MKKGFTTGSAASAAARAHALFLTNGTAPTVVDIILPDGSMLSIPVHSCSTDGASVIKDAGDDPDITHGAEICAVVEPDKSGSISIHGGAGVGVVTKAGLQLQIGKPAINPVPRQMIRNNVTSAGIKSAKVTISVPDGERLAKDTFNSRIGITGGISIIGTTGIVEPMSIEALTATIACEIDVQAEAGAKELYLVPGKIGEKHLRKHMPDVQTVIISNYAGFAIDHAVERGMSRLTLAGHPGKLAKIAMGYYNTHSKESPMAQGFIAELMGLTGEYNTVEEICAEGCDMSIIADAIKDKIESDYSNLKISVILFDMIGNMKGGADA